MNTHTINEPTASRDFTPVYNFDWEGNHMEMRTLTCTHHMDKRWLCKYVGMRTLHFIPNGPERECRCPVADLRVIG